MRLQHAARLGVFFVALATMSTASFAEVASIDEPLQRRQQRPPIMAGRLLPLEPDETPVAAAEPFPVGEASVTDPSGDLNVPAIFSVARPLSGATIGETLPGSLVSPSNFELSRSGCYPETTGIPMSFGTNRFAWQKGVSAAGGGVVTGTVSGNQNVTYSVTHPSLASPAFRDIGAISCFRRTQNPPAIEDYYQFSMMSTGQGMWIGFYFWVGALDLSDGRFDQFELPIVDITSLSATETSGGELEFKVTVAAAIPSASSTPRPVFTLAAKPASQPLGRFVSVESRDGVWKAVLKDYGGLFSFIGSDVRTDLPLTVSGNQFTVRVSKDELQLAGSSLTITSQGFAELRFSNQVFTGRADTASTSLQLTEVSLGRLPGALVQPENTAGATTGFSLVNNGTAAATVTLGATGSFFTLDASSVTIPSGGAVAVTVSGKASPAGDYNGSITLSGPGLAAGTSLPVRLLSVAPPSLPPAPRGPVRKDEAQPLGVTSFQSSIEFTNDGAGTVSGLLSSDVPWLIPQSDSVSIAPGATQSLSYTIDRSKRLYGNRPGSASATLSLNYLSATASAKRPFDSSGTSLAGVVVVDIGKPTTSATSLGPLRANEIALFLAGVQGSASGLVTDVTVSSVSLIPELSILFVPEGGSASFFTQYFPGSGVPLSLANAVNTVFDQQAVGTLVFRSNSSIASLQVSGIALNTADPRGTFGTAIPVLRSDRGAKAAESMWITGLTGRSATGRTDVILQEVAGFPANVTIDFLNASGTIVETAQKSLDAFAMTRWADAAPAGAVSAVISVAAGGEGRVSGYATPVDAARGDSWVTADWSSLLGYAPTSIVVIPVGGSVTGINGTRFGTELSLFNPGDAPVTATLTFYSELASGAPTTADVTIDPKQTKSYADVTRELFHISGRALGYIRIDPRGVALLSSSRTYSTNGTGSFLYGMGVPAIAVSQGIKRNGSRRISAIADSSPEVFLAKLPGTYRTNLGLVETSGAEATVQVTLNYEYAKSGSLAAALASKSKTYELAPNSFRLLWSLAQELLGDLRSALDSSIRSMSIEVKVTAGDGTVETFATTVDNASGDQQFKME